MTIAATYHLTFFFLISKTENLKEYLGNIFFNLMSITCYDNTNPI